MKKKLIEVALPLEAINAASAREKSIRHGHPSTLHLWWARRPLAAARAVIFSQMVDDPSSHPELFPTLEDQERERQRLFALIEKLVLWKSTTDENVIAQAREEIWKSWRLTCAENKNHPQAAELFNPDKLPAFHDPFAGGGTLPLEAQRLGLEAWASDLNPVAVTINKAMIEIPSKFAGRKPVGPKVPGDDSNDDLKDWSGAKGLAEDVRRYGAWMLAEAEKRIGHLYPTVKITEDMTVGRPELKLLLGRKLPVVTWLWARTVKSPNPAFTAKYVPLISSFSLSTNKGNEAWIEPILRGDDYHFTVKTGTNIPSYAKNGTKLGRNANAGFVCIMSRDPITIKYIRSEAQSGRLKRKLIAIVAQGENGKIYLPPSYEHEILAMEVKPSWKPNIPMPDNPRWFSPPLYGLKSFGDLFTERQLLALSTFSDLIQESIKKCHQDILKNNALDHTKSINTDKYAQDYAHAVGIYLSFAQDKCADYWCSISTWMPRGTVGHTFAQHAIPMTWDFPEANPLADFHCNWQESCGWVSKALEIYGIGPAGHSNQENAIDLTCNYRLISTDPPYYDNIGYADLSDFFYSWLRRNLQSILPHLFSTMAVPKNEELVATPYRHNGKVNAEAFFLNGMTQVMQKLTVINHPSFPTTIYYAFKQSETDKEDGTASTGWETFLDAVLKSGLSITGTWPIRTERSNRSTGQGTNALASSIVLVCRKRSNDAPTATRREFRLALKNELPEALRNLQQGNIAPVDMAQAAIGPGMAVFTRYAKVLEPDGSNMAVRQALAMINEVLDEVLAEQEGDFEPDSRWALAWFETYGFEAGEFGVADTLSKAKNTSVAGLVEAGILQSRAGEVRLLTPPELPADWDPRTDQRLTVWEMTHHLIRRYQAEGEMGAADLAARLGAEAETARLLAYRLYTICERKKWADHALSYNALVQSWPSIMKLARDIQIPAPSTAAKFDFQGEK